MIFGVFALAQHDPSGKLGDDGLAGFQDILQLAREDGLCLSFGFLCRCRGGGRGRGRGHQKDPVEVVLQGDDGPARRVDQVVVELAHGLLADRRLRRDVQLPAGVELRDVRVVGGREVPGLEDAVDHGHDGRGDRRLVLKREWVAVEEARRGDPGGGGGG